MKEIKICQYFLGKFLMKTLFYFMFSNFNFLLSLLHTEVCRNDDEMYAVVYKEISQP